MRMADAIAFRQIHAGGPGSGCHGPNCGRPAGSGKFGVKFSEGDTVKVRHASGFPVWLDKVKHVRGDYWEGHVGSIGNTTHPDIDDLRDRWISFRQDEVRDRDE